MLTFLSEYYRIPEDFLGNLLVSDVSNGVGFFRFGPETVCYGQCGSGVTANVADSGAYDASRGVDLSGSEIHLPFDPAQVIENLRRERYERISAFSRERLVNHEFVRKTYYLMRELLPVPLRRHLQRVYFSDWKNRTFPSWPVDSTVDALHQEFLRLSMKASGQKKVPFIWFWPDGAPSCLMMTHDVETSSGRDFTSHLMDLDDSYGFKASFQVIPEKRYDIPEGYVSEIRSRGFEFNIHDLNHDGRLYREWPEFVRRAAKINEYLRKYDAKGFRAGAMYRKQDWFHVFEFSYDMSVPNVAHLEPTRGGCCTVMPYFVGKIVELPLTTAQDYSLFQILNDYSIDLWRQQLAIIKARNGLMSFIAHPDYLINARARKVYEMLLEYLRKLIAQERIWAALPGDVDRWWRARSKMRLVSRNGDWEIEGLERERARVAYAVLEGDHVAYDLSKVSATQNTHA